MLLEQTMTGTAIGEFLGLPGNDRRVSFRIFHVFEFTDGLISREQVWIDGAAIVAQVSAP
jgi:predicted ester cyclase